ncbi:hypothetical protein M5D96_004040 [Drosophila gunungcola]|uniref:Uncharacterized protein n=1 Tax=Drosophila gunungcola TaxID=103775 RepID=A0A9P9YT99_9MUSC|nr:hypothetical protein M5D96_004040 [Drosophila gunungcola]
MVFVRLSAAQSDWIPLLSWLTLLTAMQCRRQSINERLTQVHSAITFKQSYLREITKLWSRAKFLL